MDEMLLRRVTNYCASSGIAFSGCSVLHPKLLLTPDSCNHPLLVRVLTSLALIRLHPLIGLGTSFSCSLEPLEQSGRWTWTYKAGGLVRWQLGESRAWLAL